MDYYFVFMAGIHIEPTREVAPDVYEEVAEYKGMVRITDAGNKVFSEVTLEEFEEDPRTLTDQFVDDHLREGEVIRTPNWVFAPNPVYRFDLNRSSLSCIFHNPNDKTCAYYLELADIRNFLFAYADSMVGERPRSTSTVD